MLVLRNSQNHSHYFTGGVNVALIVGVAVAVFVAIGLIVCGVCFLRRRRSSGYQQTGTASAVEL